MIKFDVLKRWSSEVQFTAEIDCAPNASQSIKLGLAVRWAIDAKADLRSANLYGANLRSANLRSANLYGADLYGADLGSADLYGADLYGANLRSANLRSANLRSANLYGADLYGADLYGADLYGADLGTQWIIPGPTRSDGYQFFLQKLNGDDEPKVKAGCRMFTIAEAQAHWTATRGGTPLGDETEAIVRCLCSLARSRGFIG